LFGLLILEKLLPLFISLPTGLFGQMVSTLTVHVPFDFSRNFQNFLLNGKHHISLNVWLHGALFVVVKDLFTKGNFI